MKYNTYRLDFVEDTPNRREYIKSKNLDIFEWTDKYIGVVL